MKKTLALMLSLSCSLSLLTGCAAKDSTPDNTTSQDSSSTQTDTASPDSTTTDTAARKSDDTEVAELYAANNIAALALDYGSATLVSETWDANNEWQYKTVKQFVQSGDHLLYDLERYNVNDEVTYCEAGYITDTVPGALYSWSEDGTKTMSLCIPSEYDALVAQRWLPRQDGDYETLVEKKQDETNLTEYLLTKRQNDTTGLSSDIYYFFSEDEMPSLITGIEKTDYDADGNVSSITRCNIMYGEPRQMNERAAAAVLNPANPCYLTVVTEPKTENRTMLQYQVDRSTKVTVEALENFHLYYDVDLTDPMDEIEVGQNKLTVYVVLDQQ